MDLVASGTNLIVPLANGEPVTVLDALEAAAADRGSGRCAGPPDARAARPAVPRTARYGDTVAPRLATSCRTITRPALPRRAPSTWCRATSARCRACSPGWTTAARWWSPPARRPTATATSSLGTNADYVAPFIGQVPFFLEANTADAAHVRTQRRCTCRQVAGWCEVDRPAGGGAARAGPTPSTSASPRSSPSGSPTAPCIQAGIGSIPNARARGARRPPRPRRPHRAALRRRRSTWSSGAWSPGSHKVRRAGQGGHDLRPRHAGASTTSSTSNPAVELLPVDWVNDPRVIAQERGFVSINATIEVDFLGQCGLGDRSPAATGRASGGQADFARGAMYSDGGQGFLVLPSTGRRRHGLADRAALPPEARSSRPSRTPSTRSSPSTASPSSGPHDPRADPRPRSPSPTRASGTTSRRPPGPSAGGDAPGRPQG